MYRKILVPLDGSNLSERALPLAAEMARRMAASVVLVTVIEKSADAGAPAGADAGMASETVAAYLRKAGDRLRAGVEQVSMRVASGDPASGITEVAAEEGADLIAMATRGRSGLVRGLLGSVTDRVLQSAVAPVLVVRSETLPEAGVARAVRNVIVPVDGSELSEAAIPHAQWLAAAFSATVTLMRSVRYPVAYAADGYPVGQMGDIVSMKELEADAARYLKSVAKRIRGCGVEVDCRVGHGHPRTQIVALAEELPDSLVVMTTRGASGMARWVMGSVADGVIRTAPAPTLVIRAAGR